MKCVNIQNHYISPSSLTLIITDEQQKVLNVITYFLVWNIGLRVGYYNMENRCRSRSILLPSLRSLCNAVFPRPVRLAAPELVSVMALRYVGVRVREKVGVKAL